MKINDKIKYLRIKNGYTQKELADKIGMKQNTLSDYERGTAAVSLNIIDRLSEVLGVEKTYFIDDEIESEMSLNDKNRMILEDIIDNLIQRKVITDPENIDKTTVDILIQVMKKDIEDKLKKQL